MHHIPVLITTQCKKLRLIVNIHNSYYDDDDDDDDNYYY